MRNAFVNTLIKLAEKDKNIYLLTADLGFSVFEGFRKKFPSRFVNCGVAEQNMIGVAAGLALSGKKPYVYSIIPFVTMRCFEQIRNDVVYQNLDVKIVGVGGGVVYGSLGATHHAIEDLGILRTLPNLAVFCPGDPLEAEQLMFQAYSRCIPAYIRLNRSRDDLIHGRKDKIEIGKPFIFKKGADGALVVNGVCLKTGLEIRDGLKKMGRNLSLISLPTLKPIKKDVLLKCLKEYKAVFTLEDHNILGGLGTALAEILLEEGWKGKFKRFAIPDAYFPKTGEAEYIREKYGLTADQVMKSIASKL